MGECMAYGSLPADSNVNFTLWGLQAGSHLALTDFHLDDPS